jgi:ABC-2 type transport system permease protein
MEVEKIKMKNLNPLRLIRIWLLMAKMAAQDQLTTNWGGVLFIIGKIIRFLFFFAFLFSVLSSSQTLAGFSREQVILFYLVFNLIDVTGQFLFRGIYVFRWRVVSGDFDLDLVKPLPSFFRPLFGWTDILDLITLFPLVGFIIFYVSQNQLIPNWLSFASFLFLFINAVLIAFSIHLLASSIGVMTTEIDHLIWIWRDLFNLSRFPTDIYSPGLRLVLTVLIPVIITVTVPAKALMGFLNWPTILGSFLGGLILFFLSLKFWRFALTRYSSASS